jgi:hypothetical protein
MRSLSARWLTALLLLSLALLQFLHSLDDLRTEPASTLVTALLKPQAIVGVGGALLAALLIARAHRWGPSLAVADAGLVALGFLLVHGAPLRIGPLKPYWGAGSADALQWLGVSAILICCAAVILTVRRTTYPAQL